MRKIISAILVLLLLVTGCTQVATSSKKDDKITVVTSFYPMYDFTKTIVGDKVNLVNLIPIGMSAHDWEPSAKDIATLEEADVFIYNGANMEHWVQDVLKGLSNKDLVSVDASINIELIEGHKHDHDHDEHEHDEEHEHDHDEHDHDHADHDHDHDEHDHGSTDPHTWISLRNAQKQVEVIKNALVKADSKNAEFYEKNTTDFINQLQALDKEFSEKLAETTKKEIVVTHEAFGYMMHDYGLKQVGIEGLSPTSEPDPARMVEIIKFVKEHNVQVIFFEELVNDNVAKTIAKETGAKVDVLNPLEGISEADQAAGANYLSVQKQNLTALLNALK